MASHDDHHVEEESLGAGIERQLSRFDDLKDSLNGMVSELSKLKSQCDLYKNKRQTLESDISSLNSQIQQLITDRDALRVEYNTARETNEWWSDHDRSVSASAPVHEGDAMGKLNRRNWLLEEQVKELKTDIEGMRKSHEVGVESERAISAGLRDRIGKLEERMRKQKTEKEEVENKEKASRDVLQNVMETRKGEQERWEVDKRDLGESLSREKKQVETLKAELAKMREEKETAQMELRKMKEDAEKNVKSPLRVLQTLQPNIPFAALSPCPATPTKQQRVFSPLLDTPTRQQPSSPTVSLALKYAHLEETHGQLRKAYDKLRETYNRDMNHWKEYKAVVLAREEVKKRRKEEKKVHKEASRSVSGSTSTPLPPPASGHTEEMPASAETVMAAAETAIAVDPVVLVEESGSQPGNQKKASHRDTSVTVTRGGGGDSLGSVEGRAVYTDDEAVFDRVVTRQPQPVGSRSLTSHTSYNNGDGIPVRQSRETNTTNTSPEKRSHSHSTAEEKRHSVTASRVTPWLGVSPDKSDQPSSSRKLRSNKSSRSITLDIDDIFLSPPETAAINTPPPNKKPLVRDRLGDSAARPTSLRKVALQNVVAGDETPLRSYESSTSGTPTTVGTGSKRKAMDMDGLTPVQKARQLKKISKLPASEKREIYASYKKGGRYNAPEEVQTAVRDEYEIDPEQNEGVSFAFHDVKRKKSERKGMHGGDCECCKGYYEAVGEIPRFNQGPMWKDPDVVEEREVDGAEGVREHQNKVSRHRETWTKPRTPPGYWKIGFPNTQDVAEQNQVADKMMREKEERMRREVLQRDSKWRKKGKE
ncbi:hypothetical protein CI109_104139 [Kwoniella shandongensis]|uniref:Uncharacterized protein n=1 Tax=Kwoniella shandongensis TaxID=1734106 RepID=A0A5M6C0X1_9TREE|nr:uncharacterized protein CI109_002948 [Kwoniella shandongensis]KAA5528788.1 hypothetical protein CI109_002948 [Kwoniella shandongensis]